MSHDLLQDHASPAIAASLADLSACQLEKMRSDLFDAGATAKTGWWKTCRDDPAAARASLMADFSVQRSDVLLLSLLQNGRLPWQLRGSYADAIYLSEASSPDALSVLARHHLHGSAALAAADAEGHPGCIEVMFDTSGLGIKSPSDDDRWLAGAGWGMAEEVSDADLDSDLDDFDDDSSDSHFRVTRVAGILDVQTGQLTVGPPLMAGGHLRGISTNSADFLSHDDQALLVALSAAIESRLSDCAAARTLRSDEFLSANSEALEMIDDEIQVARKALSDLEQQRRTLRDGQIAHVTNSIQSQTGIREGDQFQIPGSSAVYRVLWNQYANRPSAQVRMDCVTDSRDAADRALCRLVAADILAGRAIRFTPDPTVAPASRRSMDRDI